MAIKEKKKVAKKATKKVEKNVETKVAEVKAPEVKTEKTESVAKVDEKAKAKELAKAKEKLVKSVKSVIANIDKEIKPVSHNLDRLCEELESNSALKEDVAHLKLLNVQKSAMGVYVQILCARKEYLQGVLTDLAK